MSHSERLKELGFELPETVKPLAAYVPAVRTGNLVYTAGQLPLHGGDLSKPGKVGAEVTAAEAKAMARICAFNALSQTPKSSARPVKVAVLTPLTVTAPTMKSTPLIGFKTVPLDAPWNCPST